MPAKQTRPQGNDAVGSYALLLGAVAVALLIVPVIGDALAVVPALASVVLALVTGHRHESGRKGRVWPALVGAALSGVVLFVVVAMTLVSG